MIKRLLAIASLGVFLSGCYMAPMAFIGPVTSGFKTASLIQSGVSVSANYLVEKSTGKAISQHVMEAISGGTMMQAYFPNNENHTLTFSKSTTSEKITPLQFDLMLRSAHIQGLCIDHYYISEIKN